MNKLTVKIVHDTDPLNPREWDQYGIMACFHGRYNIGDSDPAALLDGGYINQEDYDGWNEMEADLRRRGALCIKPLYLYDHSGTSLSTQSFAGRAQHADWDSGRIGFIFTTRKNVEKMQGWKRLTKERLAKIQGYLESEVKEYDQFMTGDVYGYVIEDGAGNHIDSCWGYYGFEVVKQEAASQLAWYVENELDEMEDDDGETA